MPKRRLFHFVSFLILVLGLLFVLIHRHSDTLDPGDRAPLSTVVQSYDGSEWPLSQFAGKPLVINFWGTWCAPCLKELPAFRNLSERFSKEVIFIGLAIDSPAKEVKMLVERFDLRYPVAIADFSTLEAWKAETVPTTYVLNEYGKIAWSKEGEVTEEELERVLHDLLGLSVPRS